MREIQFREALREALNEEMRKDEKIFFTVFEGEPLDPGAVAFGIVGFWSVDVKRFGPVHEYVAPGTVDTARFNVCPAQIGLSFERIGTTARHTL